MKFLRKRTNNLAVLQTPKKYDDEGSVTSTFTADRSSKAKESHCPLQKATSVKFDLECNIEYSSSFITDEEKADQWYTQEEYKKFKSSFIELAREFHKYDKANPSPDSFKISLGQAFNTCSQATSDDVAGLLDSHNEKVLVRWFSKGSRRGVERASVPVVFADKSSRRKRINAAVLDAQDQSEHLSTDARWERLRAASEDISLTSRLFAYVLAK